MRRRRLVSVKGEPQKRKRTPFAEATIKTSRAEKYIVSKLCMLSYGLSFSCNRHQLLIPNADSLRHRHRTWTHSTDLTHRTYKPLARAADAPIVHDVAVHVQARRVDVASTSLVELDLPTRVSISLEEATALEGAFERLDADDAFRPGVKENIKDKDVRISL